MNAYNRILDKQNTQLYKKVGRKYIPENDIYALDGLREGWWLVKVAPGSTSIRQAVYPHKAEIQAAAKDKTDQLVEIILKASEARPKSIPLSEQAKADWDWFMSRNGKEFNTLEYPSIQENAEKIIEALLQK
jgi:hypothetical protein